jgi:kinesin family protein C2/C3
MLLTASSSPNACNDHANNKQNVEAQQAKLIAKAVAEAEARKEQEKQQALKEMEQAVTKRIAAAEASAEEYKALYSKENRMRKAIHNKLLELQGNIRVMCRVRPILEVERRSGQDVDVTEFPSPEDIIIHRDELTKAHYEFDRTFPPQSTQQEVFEQVQPLAISCMDGYNVCIFAYGQTGSGKTFTMEGPADNRGVR